MRMSHCLITPWIGAVARTLDANSATLAGKATVLERRRAYMKILQESDIGRSRWLEFLRDFNASHASENCVNPPHPFGESCRTRLKDETRLNFIDVCVSDGSDPRPILAGLNHLLVHLHSAPRSDDDIGVAGNDRAWIDNPVA